MRGLEETRAAGTAGIRKTSKQELKEPTWSSDGRTNRWLFASRLEAAAIVDKIAMASRRCKIGLFSRGPR
jgi:hypothetical protein